eukprot:Skav211501  [mRNA]  locus=scaffold2188:871170:871607:+ [translate_table: standard]
MPHGSAVTFEAPGQRLARRGLDVAHLQRDLRGGQRRAERLPGPEPGAGALRPLEPGEGGDGSRDSPHGPAVTFEAPGQRLARRGLDVAHLQRDLRGGQRRAERLPGPEPGAGALRPLEPGEGGDGSRDGGGGTRDGGEGGWGPWW